MPEFVGVQEPKWRKIIYVDINTQFRIDNQDLIVTNINALNNQIFNVLMTIPGERAFEPEFGSNVPFLLWDPMDDTTAWNIETALFAAVSRWLSDRLQVNHRLTRVTPYYDQGMYDSHIVYYSPLADEAGDISLNIRLPSMNVLG